MVWDSYSIKYDPNVVYGIQLVTLFRYDNVVSHDADYYFFLDIITSSGSTEYALNDYDIVDIGVACSTYLIYVSIEDVGVSTYDVSLKIYDWLSNLKYSRTWSSQSWGGSLDYLKIDFASAYVNHDPITDDARSSYKYITPTTKQHKLNLFPSTTLDTFKIYSHASWDFIYAIPEAYYVERIFDGGVFDYYLISTQVIEPIEVFFVSNCSNHLAIQDVSSTYLTDVGFETGEYRNDWGFTSDNNWETIEIATDIVSEGSYSLHLERTADYDTLSLMKGTLENGDYWFSFDVYFVTKSDDNIYFIFHTSEAADWQLYRFTDFQTGHWYKCFVYIPLLAGTDVDIVRLRASAGNHELYLDNFKIFKASTTIETTQSSEYEIESTLISWDG